MTEKKQHRGHNEGTIYQTADGKWRGAVFLGVSPAGKPRRKYVSGRTKVEVKDKVKRILSDHDRGLPVSTKSQTVQQFLESWLESVVKPNERPRTYESYESIVRVHLVPSIGRHRLEKLTAQHIQTMLTEKRAAGLSGRSLLNIRAIIRAALNQAMRWDLVGRNVATLTDPPKLERFEAKPLSPPDVLRFLKRTEGDRLEAMYVLTVWLGLRQGEVFGLRWQDVHFEEGEIRIQKQLQWTGKAPKVAHLVDPKTEQSKRRLPLPKPVADALRHHRQAQLEEQLLAGRYWKGKEWNLVFCSSIGTPLDPSNVTKQYRVLLAGAGVEQRRFHDLRHSCGTFLTSRNVHPRVIMQVLGHSQISTTMNTYSHVEVETMRDALDSITDLFEQDKQSS